MNPVSLKAIGEAFGVEIEKPLKPVTDQWIKAGLLEKKDDLFIPTVAGQFWYVTMAQLLTEALTGVLSKGSVRTEDLIEQSVYSPNQGQAWLDGVPRK